MLSYCLLADKHQRIFIQSSINLFTSVSQKETDKYHMISLIWNLKFDTSELLYETETDSQT